MEMERATISLAWNGPVAEAEVPPEILYDIRLRFDHDGDVGAAVEQALSSFAGAAKRTLLGRLSGTMHFRRDPWNLDVRIGKDRVQVRALNRLKPKAVGRLVDALGQVPGARDLWIDAAVPRFSDAYSNLRACSPCMAARMR